MHNMPVPSKGVLSYLRQALIYGTLGTTTAAGFLIAEERRRHIRFLERVVDNGKRLRGSERYIHGQARDLSDFFQYATFARSSDYPGEIEKVYTVGMGEPNHKKKRRQKKVGLDASGTGNLATTAHPENDAQGHSKERSPKILKESALDAKSPSRAHSSQMSSTNQLMRMDRSTSANGCNGSSTSDILFQDVSRHNKVSGGFRSLYRRTFTGGSAKSSLEMHLPQLPSSIGRSTYLLPKSFRCGISSLRREPNADSEPDLHDREGYIDDILRCLASRRPGEALNLFVQYHLAQHSSKSTLEGLMMYSKIRSGYLRPQDLEYISVDKYPYSHQDKETLRKSLELLYTQESSSVIESFKDLFPQDISIPGKSVIIIARSIALAVSLNAICTGRSNTETLDIMTWLRENDHLRIADTEYLCTLFIDNRNGTKMMHQPVQDILENFASHLSPQAFRESFLKSISTLPDISKTLPRLEESRTHDISIDAPRNAGAIEDISQLLHEGKLRAAATAIEQIDPRNSPNMSQPYLHILRDISAIALHELDGSILERMEILSRCEARPDSVCYKNAMKYALLVGNIYEDFNIIELYRRQGEQVLLPKAFYPRICKAFARRVECQEAFKISCSIIQLGLSPYHLKQCFFSLSYLLSRFWNESRAFEAVQERYREIEHIVGAHRMPKSLKNTMLHISMEAGMQENAHKYLPSDGGGNISPAHPRTLSYIMLGHALNEDWDRVREVLQFLKSTQIAKVDKKGCRALFNSVLKIYGRSHNSKEVQAFLYAAIAKYCVEIDQFSYDFVSTCLVKDKRLHEIFAFTKTVSDFGYHFQISPAAVCVITHDFFLRHKPSGGLIYNFARALLAMRPEILTSDFFAVIYKSILYAHRQGYYRNDKTAQHVFQMRSKEIEELMKSFPAAKWNTNLCTRQLKRSGIVAFEISKAWYLNQWADIQTIAQRATEENARMLPRTRIQVADAITREDCLNNSELEALLKEAEESRFDALSLLSTQIIRRLRRNESFDPKKLCVSVISVYRSHYAKRRDFNYALVTAAATWLTIHGLSKAAIGLLRNVHDMSIYKIPLDELAASAWIHAAGHTFRPSLPDLAEVVGIALREGTTISPRILMYLNSSCAHCISYEVRRGGQTDAVNAMISRCRVLFNRVKKRRVKQHHNTRMEINVLIDVLTNQTVREFRGRACVSAVASKEDTKTSNVNRTGSLIQEQRTPEIASY